MCKLLQRLGFCDSPNSKSNTRFWHAIYFGVFNLVNSRVCSYAYNTFDAHLSQELHWQRVMIHAAGGMGVYTEGCSDISFDECVKSYIRLLLILCLVLNSTRKVRGQTARTHDSNVAECRRLALFQHAWRCHQRAKQLV